MAGGIAVAAVAAPALFGLFGVTPRDETTLAIGLAALACAAFVAGVIPAHAAARIDPLVALRVD